jgi:hypothetical protein
VRARNIYGFGSFSDVSTVVASSVPGEPEIATTTTQGTGTVIGFFAPDTNGAMIQSYTIKIAGIDDIFFESQDDYFSCTVSFKTLRADPFFLIYNSLVSVIV